MSTRRPLLAAVALATGSCLALATPTAATASPTPVPQFIIHFAAIAQPPVSTQGLPFHSTSCTIGPATHPILVTCKETGFINFTATGGSGTAAVSSAMAGINWTFTLTRTAASSSTTYAMSGTGTESTGASPAKRPVRITGTITVTPTPDPTFKGTENVYPVPPPPAAPAITPLPPTIVANPNNLMVNTDTNLTGRNFPPATTLKLVECGKTTWVVTQHPCDTNNTVTVTTGPTGGFRTPFKAELCPGGKRVGPTAIRCYIGVPEHSGVDTVVLHGPAAVTVTYP